MDESERIIAHLATEEVGVNKGRATFDEIVDFLSMDYMGSLYDMEFRGTCSPGKHYGNIGELVEEGDDRILAQYSDGAMPMNRRVRFYGENARGISAVLEYLGAARKSQVALVLRGKRADVNELAAAAEGKIRALQRSYDQKCRELPWGPGHPEFDGMERWV